MYSCSKNTENAKKNTTPVRPDTYEIYQLPNSCRRPINSNTASPYTWILKGIGAGLGGKSLRVVDASQKWQVSWCKLLAESTVLFQKEEIRLFVSRSSVYPIHTYIYLYLYTYVYIYIWL